MGSAYALITAAKNEEAYIHQTLQSVVNQTQLPKIWIIISDGSTDHTDEFVMDFSRKYDFIRLLRFDNQGARTFSSKVFALNGGYEFIKKTEFEFVGFLDADISFDFDYYEKLLKIFKARPGLGIVGGEILEYQSGRFQPRFGNSESDVGGAIQFFRRQYYEDIGSRFIPLQYGGYDFVANRMARKKGWEVQSVLGLPVFHHRRTGTAGMSLWRTRFQEGRITSSSCSFSGACERLAVVGKRKKPAAGPSACCESGRTVRHLPSRYDQLQHRPPARNRRFGAMLLGTRSYERCLRRDDFQQTSATAGHFRDQCEL